MGFQLYSIFFEVNQLKFLTIEAFRVVITPSGEISLLFHPSDQEFGKGDRQFQLELDLVEPSISKLILCGKRTNITLFTEAD